MATDIGQFLRELRAFDRRRAVVQTMRRRLRAGHAPQVKAIRQAYRLELPKGGGLNEWAAKSTISLQVRYTGRTAGISLRGRRKSQRDRSDLAGLDRGRVRHPSWGRRGSSQWHGQAVKAGVFTNAVDISVWAPLIDRVLDEALEVIRG